MTEIDIVAKAKATLLTQRKPFYTVCAMRLKFVAITKDDPRSKQFQFQTMATDGARIYYNVEWTEKLTKEEVIGVICHEILHVALLHPLRLFGKHMLVWNFATDYAINQMLTDDNFQLPKGGLQDDKYRSWNSDKIYNELMKDVKKITSSKGGKGKDGKEGPEWGQIVAPMDENGKPLSQADIRGLEIETKILVQSAAEAAKGIGNLPGAIQELVDKYTNPVVNWQDYLPKWLLGSQPDDYTWRKPNRKYMVPGKPKIFMPSVDHRGSGNGVFYIDTSGSVSTKELQRYLSEIVGIIEECDPETLLVVPCDTEVKGPFKWVPGDTLTEIKVEGRGGTRVTPAFEWAHKHHDEVIDWAIYFTDLEVSDFPEEPNYPVLWLSTGQENAPWGNVIKCRREQ